MVVKMHKGTNTPCFKDVCIFHLEAAICCGVSKACYHWHLIFQFPFHQNNKILKQLTSAQRPKRRTISEGIGGVLTMKKVKFHGGQILESLTYYVRKGQTECQKMYGGEAEIINKLRIFKWTDGKKKKKKDENFKNNSNASTAFKNAHKQGHKS